GEIADAVTLLLGGECAMVGCDALQASGRKACPQTILVDLVAEWRRHHAACRIIPVLVMVFALVKRQMLDQWLAEHAHTLLPGTADRFMALLAGNMHDIKRHACL